MGCKKKGPAGASQISSFSDLCDGWVGAAPTPPNQRPLPGRELQNLYRGVRTLAGVLECVQPRPPTAVTPEREAEKKGGGTMERVFSQMMEGWGRAGCGGAASFQLGHI